jgi:hypothetical protein
VHAAQQQNELDGAPPHKTAIPSEANEPLLKATPHKSYARGRLHFRHPAPSEFLT